MALGNLDLLPQIRLGPDTSSALSQTDGSAAAVWPLPFMPLAFIYGLMLQPQPTESLLFIVCDYRRSKIEKKQEDRERGRERKKHLGSTLPFPSKTFAQFQLCFFLLKGPLVLRLFKMVKKEEEEEGNGKQIGCNL